LNYATELVLVLADGLTERGRKTVSLTALSALLHRRRRPTTPPMFTLDEAELRRQSKMIIGQLAASGLCDDRRTDVLLFCLSILDALADLVPDEIVADAALARSRLARRIQSFTGHAFSTDPYEARLRQLEEKQP
jgi:hypothetical protein